MTMSGNSSSSQNKDGFAVQGEANPTQDHALHSSVPDPDEDDLDDLDDLLDDFSGPKPAPTLGDKSPTVTNHDNEQASKTATSDRAAEEFSKQLQEQMAALMSEAEESPEMQRELEAMVEELGEAVAKGEDPQRQGSSAHSDNYTKGEKSFQETIRQTMERIQTSGEHATAATTSDDPDDVLARMLGQMKNGILDDAGSEEDFSKMLMNMMEQLTNKDILYEPMKELQDKFPAWMDKNRSVTSAKDLKRYEEQQRLAGEIVSRFNDEDYSDSNAADRQYIVERMQLMQAAGSPPADLVGDMDAAHEALGDLDAGCAQQ